MAKGLSDKGHDVHFIAPQGSQSNFGTFHPIMNYNGGYAENEVLDEVSLEGLKVSFLYDFDFILDFSAICRNIEEVRNYGGNLNYGVFRNGYNGYTVPRLRLKDRHYMVPSIQNKNIFEKHGFTEVYVAYYGIPDEFYFKGEDEEYNIIINGLEKKNYFLYNARPTSEKGSDDILRLAQHFPDELFVFMVSNNPVTQHKDAIQYLKKECVNKSLQNVKFVELPLTNKHHYFKRELMRHAKAILSPFNPRIYLEGFGLANAEAVACLPKGSLVSTPNGMKMIDKIIEGERVHSTTGTVKVLERFERDFKGDLIVLKGKGMMKVKFTPEHPILVYRNGKEEFVRADEVLTSDRLVIRRKTIETYPEFKVMNNLTFRQKNDQERTFVLDENIAYLLGWYNAEGSTHHGNIQFDLGNNDIYYIQRLKNIIQNVFGRKPYFKEDGTRCRLSFNFKGLAELLRNWCGLNARTKRVPSLLYDCNESTIYAYFAGYLFGDGYYEIGKGRFKGVTASKQLALDSQILAAKIKQYINISEHFIKGHNIIRENITRIIPDTIRYNLSFPKSFSYNIYTSEFASRFNAKYELEMTEKMMRSSRTLDVDSAPLISSDAIYITITEIGKEYNYDGKVYNLHTEDGTFAVPFITHNCGTPILITDSESSRELWIDEKDGLIIPYDDRLWGFKQAIQHFNSYNFSPENKFTVDDCISNYENYINKMIEENNK